MSSFRCNTYEWQLPDIREQVLNISPEDYSTRFFAIPANPRPRSATIRALLTQAFTRSIDFFESKAPLPPGRSRRVLMNRWKNDSYWTRYSGTPLPLPQFPVTNSLSLHNIKDRAMARSNPQGLDNHRPRKENDASGVSATYPFLPRPEERSHAWDERRYNMPPASSLSISNMTLSAFYYRFCDANPEARRIDPWDAILAAYEKYISEHYGKNLDHVWAAYKSTNLRIPHDIKWRHCVRIENELKLEKATKGSPRALPGLSRQELSIKRRRDSKEAELEPSPKRIKDKVDDNGTLPSTNGLGAVPMGRLIDKDKALLPLSIPGNTGPAAAPLLYSPTTPHINVTWTAEEPTPAATALAAQNPPVQNIVSETPNEFSSRKHGAEAASAAVRGTRSYQMPTPTPPITPKNNVATQNKSDEGNNIQPVAPGDANTAGATNSKVPNEAHPTRATSTVGQQGDPQQPLYRHAVRLQAFLQAATTEIRHNDDAPSAHGIRLEGFLHMAGAEVKMLRSSIEDPMNDGKVTGEEHQLRIQKPVGTYVMRMEAFINGAVAELDHVEDDKPTPESIRLEALVCGAAAELTILKGAVEA